MRPELVADRGGVGRAAIQASKERAVIGPAEEQQGGVLRGRDRAEREEQGGDKKVHGSGTNGLG